MRNDISTKVLNCVEMKVRNYFSIIELNCFFRKGESEGENSFCTTKWSFPLRKKNPTKPKQNSNPNKTKIYFDIIFIKVSMSPRQVPSIAAKRTLKFSGSRKVMVCMGIQKSRILRTMARFQKFSQFIFLRYLGTSGFFIREMSEPLCSATCASVRLCVSMRMGAKKQFMVRLTQKAAIIFSILSVLARAVAPHGRPSLLSMSGAPVENMMKAAVMAIPRSPQRIAFGSSP